MNPRWIVLSLCIAAPLAGQAPCGTENHRAFDFWIGEWDVHRSADGGLAGTNRIEAILGGCVLHESYETPQGYAGESFSIFDGSRGVWHQSWVDNGGLLLQIEGGIRNGAMVLEGTTTGADGTETRNRITWTVLDADGDRVRQLWETSTDGGATWSAAFDGEYRRRGP